MTAVEEVPVKVEFDPETTTIEHVAKLATKQECAAVFAYCGVPVPPKSWKLDETRRMAGSMLAVKRGVVVEAAAGAAPAEVDPEAPADPVPGTALEQRVSLIPEASKFHDLKAMAIEISKSKIVPKALQDNPEDTLIVLLAANDLGIPITQAVDKIHVIDGKKGMAAELMVALALRDGHAIWPDPANNDEIATVHIRRADTGVEADVSFTIDEAVHAGLVGMKDGKPYKRSQSGKAQPWELYTADLLWARCVSRAMRRVCPDCLAGVSYTPEELGSIDQDDAAVTRQGRHGEATVTLNERREQISTRCRGLSKDGKQALVAEWTRKNLPKSIGDDQKWKIDFTKLSAGAISAVDRFLDGLGPESWAAVEPEPSNGEPEGGQEPSDPAPGSAGSPEPGDGDSGALPDTSTDAVINPVDEPAEGEIVEEEGSGTNGEDLGQQDGFEDADLVVDGPLCSDPLCLEPADPESTIGGCTMHKEF